MIFGEKFLAIVLGQDGAKALAKAAERAPILSSVLVPRTIISWLSTAVRLGYEGEIPGLDNSYISLNKTEAGTFVGALTVSENVHSFDGADLLHVAAAIGVALGVADQKLDPQLKGQDLGKLGKSIDLLVRARVVTDALREQGLAKTTVFEVLAKPSIEKVEMPGRAAGPLEPTPPTPPDGQKKQAAMKAPPFGKKEVNITKTESERKCWECGGRQFQGSKLVGCLCFSGLLKSSKVAATPDSGGNYVLKFVGHEWDQESIQAFVGVLKG